MWDLKEFGHGEMFAGQFNQVLYGLRSRWDQCVADGNKLAQLKPSLGTWSPCSQRCRRLEVSVPRLHIGHTRLTNGHLMAREAHLVCGHCQVRLSIFHTLVEYPTYSVPRNRFYPSLTSLPPRERLTFHLLLALRLFWRF